MTIIAWSLAQPNSEAIRRRRIASRGIAQAALRLERKGGGREMLPLAGDGLETAPLS